MRSFVRRLATTALCCVVVVGTACSHAAGPTVVDEAGSAVLPGNNRLVFADSGRLQPHHETITTVVRRAVELVRGYVPFDGVRIEVVVDLSFVIPELGLGGYAVSPDAIMLTFDPDSPVLSASIDSQLVPLVAHEAHHVMRIRARGHDGTLLDAMVFEGLADHFSIEVTGIQPPMWAIALSPAELAVWYERARDQWFDTSYDFRAWFFGSRSSIPRWTGYAVGFEIVRAYLAARPAQRASGLYGEPATSFVPDG